MSLTHINRGRSLESVIPVSQRGIVVVDKFSAEAKWLKGGNRVVRQKGKVDWIGTVCGTGRMICFDTKQTDRPNGFPISSIEPHQVEYLNRHGEAGAIAGVLCEATQRGRFYWIHYAVLDRHWLLRRQVEWHEMVDLGDTLHTVDFLRVPGVKE